MSNGNGSISGSQYAKAISINRRSPPSLIVGSKYPPEKKKEKKKMGWFRKKFNNWVRRAWEDAQEKAVYSTDTIRPHDGITGKSSVRFTIYAASGGHIIEYYKNDRYKEHDGPELVIVNTGDSLGTAVEHILTMEALKS